MPIRDGGTTHYLVLGAGIVSVNNTNKEVAGVSRAGVVGFMASPRGVKLGYATESTVSIKTNENVVVEVSRPVFGPLKVVAPNWSSGYVVETKAFNPTNVCVTSSVH